VWEVELEGGFLPNDSTSSRIFGIFDGELNMGRKGVLTEEEGEKGSDASRNFAGLIRFHYYTHR
jgi:hypothetical protein